ncbi:MAG: ribulokinase [Lentisphaeria bacterium]|nr:ribulokinase [Lentisphaeria bacterium]
MAKELLIGLDFGSDSVRALLIDSCGKQIAESVAAYPRWQSGLYSNAGECRFRQHPLDYLECMEQVIKAVLEHGDPACVRGIGVDTTSSTLCAVGSDGIPLSLTEEFKDDPDAMFVLWKDHTAISEADRINEIAWNSPCDYTLYSGGNYSCEWFWSKVLHILRVNEKVRAKAFSFVEHCDWITALLAGSKVKNSRCAAGHKALWHASWGGLPPEEFFTSVDPLLAGFRERIGSETFTADTPVGTISQEWASRLGLPADVVIAAGAIDCHVGAVGAGIVPGEMVKVLGTSTCDIIVMPTIERCIPGICGQVDGSVVPGYTGLEAGQSAFGDIYAWFRRFLEWSGAKVSLFDLEKEAAALPESSVMALDWMNGRRTPDSNPLLQGAVFGLTLGSTPPMVYRALVEATVFGTRAIFERFKEQGLEIKSIKATGGIAKKSPFVMQYCADALNMPVAIVNSDQTCALGASMFGAVASGVYPDLRTAQTAMESGCGKVYTPQKNCDERYGRYLQYARSVENIG